MPETDYGFIEEVKELSHETITFEYLCEQYPHTVQKLDAQRSNLLSFFATKQGHTRTKLQWYRLAMREVPDMAYSPEEPYINQIEFYALLDKLNRTNFLSIKENRPIVIKPKTPPSERWYRGAKNKLKKYYSVLRTSLYDGKTRAKTFFVALYYKILDIFYRVRIF